MTDEILKTVRALPAPAIIAIDGRCGAGKTTLALKLQKQLRCSIIHMDDFFLRPEQRTLERLNEPGGNVDYERFYDEVIIPLKESRAFSYKPFLCHTQTFGDPVFISPSQLTIIEGSYSCHPRFWDFCDLHIFLDIDPQEQIKRITQRNGKAAAKLFEDIWIPLEEKYFEAYNIKEKCEIKAQSI